MMRLARNTIILFIAGGIVGSICDGFHSHSGILAYTDIWWMKMAWWVPFLFGSATLALAISHMWADQILHHPRRHLSWGLVFLGLVLFVAMYAGSAYIPAANRWKFLILSIGGIAIWRGFDGTWQGAVEAVISALIGCSVEITLTQQELFQYLNPNLWGIPSWLPWLYVAASVSVGNLSRKLISVK